MKCELLTSSFQTCGHLLLLNAFNRRCSLTFYIRPWCFSFTGFFKYFAGNKPKYIQLRYTEKVTSNMANFTEMHSLEGKPPQNIRELK